MTQVELDRSQHDDRTGEIGDGRLRAVDGTGKQVGQDRPQPRHLIGSRKAHDDTDADQDQQHAQVNGQYRGASLQRVRRSTQLITGLIR